MLYDATTETLTKGPLNYDLLTTLPATALSVLAGVNISRSLRDDTFPAFASNVGPGAFIAQLPGFLQTPEMEYLFTVALALAGFRPINSQWGVVYTPVIISMFSIFMPFFKEGTNNLAAAIIKNLSNTPSRTQLKNNLPTRLKEKFIKDQLPYLTLGDQRKLKASANQVSRIIGAQAPTSTINPLAATLMPGKAEELLKLVPSDKQDAARAILGLNVSTA